MNAKSLTEILAIQIRYTHWVVNANLADLPDEDYVRSPEPGGNCLAWVLGHLVQARNGWLAMMGQDPVIATETIDRYRRGSAPISGPEDGVSPAELRAAFNRAQEPLVAGLNALTDEVLTQKAPFSPGNDDKETVGSLLAGLAFHEAYHAGQIGVIRRTLGAAGVVK